MGWLLRNIFADGSWFGSTIAIVVLAAVMVSGCSSELREPPNSMLVAEFNSALESFGEGRWSSITVTVSPKHTIDVQIEVKSGTHAIALKAYCNVVKDAFADAGLTDYKLVAKLRYDGNDKTC
ncbi:MAG TPA: hypothetical protein QGI62_08210 [Anaerolineales bacterium]|jgi:hypothetical protein|nr:hypothetical protein [Anaerolineales bacterium]|tara:strand:+ start:222 stop:590 length:369 start_codon:yes stop_codon:yes gene_type:complete